MEPYYSNVPTYALLDNNNSTIKGQLVTADAKKTYTTLESKSSYLHVLSWSLLALMILCLISSTFM